MSLVLQRILASVTRAQIMRARLNPTKQALLSTSEARNDEASTGYDEEADDRDRFKHDKFYNTVVLFGTPIMLSTLLYMAYWGHTLGRHFDQEKYVPYPYLCVRRNPLPWGDGNHTLFHNPETNYVPGVGFEKKQEKHH